MDNYLKVSTEGTDTICRVVPIIDSDERASLLDLIEDHERQAMEFDAEAEQERAAATTIRAKLAELDRIAPVKPVEKPSLIETEPK